MRHLLVLIVALFLSSTVDAQVHIDLGFNIGSQPVWGPTGYDHVEYYYLPDIEVYYNVPQHKYFYYDGGRWIGRSSLPPRYRGYDFYNSYKVVLNEPTPYLHHNIYRERYFSFKGRHDQQPIRDSHDSKYFVNKNHPEHNNWLKQQKHESGRGHKPNEQNKQNKQDQHRNDGKEHEDAGRH
jgi:hypothetical protein